MEIVAGRKKRQAESKDCRLTIRLTPEQLRRVEMAAKDAGVSESEYGRKVLLEGLDARRSELLRIVAELVQIQVMRSVLGGTSVTKETVTEWERKAAGQAVFVLARRLGYLDSAMTEEAKGEVA